MASIPSDPRDTRIHDLFRAQQTATPQATALIQGEQRITYAELEHLSNAVADRFRAIGVGQGEVVVVLSQRSVEAIVAMLAILKVGASYATLDPTYPPEHLRLAFASCSPRLLLWGATAEDGAQALVARHPVPHGHALATLVGDARAGVGNGGQHHVQPNGSGG